MIRCELDWMMEQASKLCGPGILDYHHHSIKGRDVTRFTKVFDKTDTLLLFSI